MPYRFEVLSRDHDRTSFKSSSKALNRYLQTLARKDIERRASVAYVLIDEVKPKTIAGYYTLSAFTVELTELPGSLQKQLPRYPRLPATLLGRLARDYRFPGTGPLLLMDALERAFRQSGQIASLAVVAEAKDEKAAAFYQKFGFEVLGNHTNRMFLSMGTIEQLLSAPK